MKTGLVLSKEMQAEEPFFVYVVVHGKNVVDDVLGSFKQNISIVNYEKLPYDFCAVVQIAPDLASAKKPLNRKMLPYPCISWRDQFDYYVVLSVAHLKSISLDALLTYFTDQSKENALRRSIRVSNGFFVLFAFCGEKDFVLQLAERWKFSTNNRGIIILPYKDSEGIVHSPLFFLSQRMKDAQKVQDLIPLSILHDEFFTFDLKAYHAQSPLKAAALSSWKPGWLSYLSSFLPSFSSSIPSIPLPPTPTSKTPTQTQDAFTNAAVTLSSTT